MIKLHQVTKDYKNGRCCTHALRGVDLEVKKGEFVAIVGTSGSGKSTLLHIIGGMDTLTSGQYICDGHVVSDLTAAKLQQFRKQYISFVFQNFALMDRYSVYENVEMPLLARRVKKRDAIIMQYLEQMGIADLKDKKPTQLSGGQQQRCAIARALAADTPILLADEPTGALDKETSSEIMNCFETALQAGKTIILITHDMQIAKRCGSIVQIEDGAIIG